MAGQGQHRPAIASSSGAAVVIGATFIVLGLLGAAVALALSGLDPASIIGVLTAVGTVAGALLVVLPKLVQLQQTVEEVKHQTDGELRAHISRTGDAIATQAANHVLTALGHPPAPAARAHPRARGGKHPAA